MKYNGTGTYYCNSKCKGCRPLALDKDQFMAIIKGLRDIGKAKLAVQVLKMERVVVSCPQTQSYTFFPPNPDEFRKHGDI